MKSLLSKSVLRFGQKCIYICYGYFKIFSKKSWGQKDVGHTPNLNCSIFSSFIYVKMDHLNGTFFKDSRFQKKLTLPPPLSVCGLVHLLLLGWQMLHLDGIGLLLCLLAGHLCLLAGHYCPLIGHPCLQAGHLCLLAGHIYLLAGHPFLLYLLLEL